jgi:hypothetical protein
MLVLNSQVLAVRIVGSEGLSVLLQHLLELLAFGFAVYLLSEVSIELRNLYYSYIFLLLIPYIQVILDSIA